MPLPGQLSVQINMVQSERTNDDRRRKRHRLPGWVMAAIERTSLKAAEWVLAMQRQYQAVQASDGGSVLFAKPGMLRGSWTELTVRVMSQGLHRMVTRQDVGQPNDISAGFSK